MKEVKPNELIKEVANIQSGEQIFIKISEEVGKKIQLLYIQRESYENLFRTCIMDNNEISNSFNVERFLKEYANNYMEFENLFIDTLLSTVGTEVYEVMSKLQLQWKIDWIINCIVIYK